MPVETLTSDAAWPQLGNPPMATLSPEENPGWEMIDENENTVAVNNNVVILPSDTAAEAVRNSGVVGGRPRSATIGGEAAAASSTLPRSYSRASTSGKAAPASPRRTLRRCASTPDLLVGDKDHEVIEDEGNGLGDESFEVVDEKRQDSPDEDDEPVMIDEDCHTAGEESGTLVSTPSMTSSWTMASSAMPAATTAWGGAGMKKSPSFAEMLAKNIDSDDHEWGKDKALTEAKLRDSHRRHHLRVRTKPKFVVSSGGGTPGKMMKHAHSTGDLTKMLTAVEEGARERCGTRQIAQVAAAVVTFLGIPTPWTSTIAKEQGSKSTANKKKERPDEAKRREIIMHKKEMQRKKQAESQKGGGNVHGGGKKKKKEKEFSGKKERRRL
ncbi:hypothetical protein ACHAXT_007796 [Thalassiosira profunda]